jgi:hypothetical protein
MTAERRTLNAANGGNEMAKGDTARRRRVGKSNRRSQNRVAPEPPPSLKAMEDTLAKEGIASMKS